MTLTTSEIITSLKGLKVYDISPIFETDMPTYITHPPVEIIHNARNFEQNGYYSQTLVIPEHSGFHVDAPRTFKNKCRTRLLTNIRLIT